MNNRDLGATWKYHNDTKHSRWSIRSDPHFLDFSNQPLPFKLYSGLEPLPLPQDFTRTGTAALSAIAPGRDDTGGSYVPDTQTLASLFYYSAGITKRGGYPGSEMFFRAAACTGALYHIELYLVCGDLPDLEAGVYHFGAHDFSLRRLRRGDYRGSLVRASGNERSVATAPAVLVLTGTFWRNAWKYRNRTYRHCFWDSGTILANLLAISAAQRAPVRVVEGFVDGSVNHLLGLDTRREVALSLVAFGHMDSSTPGPPPEAPELNLDTAPLSKTEVDYPDIREMHGASSLESEREASAWHSEGPSVSLPEPSGKLFPLQPLSDDEAAGASIEQVIVRRGSTRRFADQAISFSQLSTMLHRATQGVPADFLDPKGATLNTLYLIVNAVKGLPEGAYIYHRDRIALELLKEGQFRQTAGYLGLEQELPADASADVFFLADLGAILEQYGNRGYRAAQLEAAIMGGKLYLGAYAQRLGASGLTFFDDDVTEFFSPHAAGKSVMFLVALGVPVRRHGANQ